jgi:hypothetical protein
MNDTLGIVLSTFGLIGFAGGAVGYFAKGRAEAVIALSAKENALLKDDVARLEKTNAALTAENARLVVENTQLWNKAQGSDKLVELAGDIKGLVDYVKKNREAK